MCLTVLCFLSNFTPSLLLQFLSNRPRSWKRFWRFVDNQSTFILYTIQSGFFLYMCVYSMCIFDYIYVLFQIILALGNYMNSSKRGAVYGFKLQSLDLVTHKLSYMYIYMYIHTYIHIYAHTQHSQHDTTLHTFTICSTTQHNDVIIKEQKITSRHVYNRGLNLFYIIIIECVCLCVCVCSCWTQSRLTGNRRCFITSQTLWERNIRLCLCFITNFTTLTKLQQVSLSTNHSAAHTPCDSPVCEPYGELSPSAKHRAAHFPNMCV